MILRSSFGWRRVLGLLGIVLLVPIAPIVYLLPSKLETRMLWHRYDNIAPGVSERQIAVVFEHLSAINSENDEWRITYVNLSPHRPLYSIRPSKVDQYMAASAEVLPTPIPDCYEHAQFLIHIGSGRVVAKTVNGETAWIQSIAGEFPGGNIAQLDNRAMEAILREIPEG